MGATVIKRSVGLFTIPCPRCGKVFVEILDVQAQGVAFGARMKCKSGHEVIWVVGDNGEGFLRTVVQHEEQYPKDH